MRLSADAGGGGMSLFDCCLMMEQAGRRLASAPLAEAVVALRMLGELGGDIAKQWIDKVRDGETVLTLALHPVKAGVSQLVPGAAVARGILTRSEEHTSELQSLMRISYAVFCLKQK